MTCKYSNIYLDVRPLDSGVRRKFPGGGKFCHNRVTSQINFRGSAEGTIILERPKACLRENFAKLHLKLRIFVHSGSKF